VVELDQRETITRSLGVCAEEAQAPTSDAPAPVGITCREAAAPRTRGRICVRGFGCRGRTPVMMKLS